MCLRMRVLYMVFSLRISTTATTSRQADNLARNVYCRNYKNCIAQGIPNQTLQMGKSVSLLRSNKKMRPSDQRMNSILLLDS